MKSTLLLRELLTDEVRTNKIEVTFSLGVEFITHDETIKKSKCF